MDSERDPRNTPTVVEGLRRRPRRPRITVTDDGRWVLEVLAELIDHGTDLEAPER